MGTGYTRTDTINNIADGNIINASDFDAEYDAIEAAFNSSSGHTHDGTSSEGGPVTVLGPAQDFVASTTEIKPKSNNTLDIGTTGLKFKDMHLAGTANLVNLTTTGDVTLTGAANNVVFDASDNALEFADNAKGVFGAGDDLQIYHDGTNSYIENNTNELFIQGDGITLRSDTGTETYIAADVNGAVELYHDNSKKLETTATGVTITGSLAMDGLHLDDNEKLTLGNSSSPDLEIFHNGSNSIIKDAGQGALLLLSDQIQIQNASGGTLGADFTEAGAVNLYHNGNGKFATDADGINVTGQVDVSTDVNLTTDGRAIKLGASEEVTLTHVHDVGVTLNVENSTTNGVTDVLKLQAQSSGTPAIGIGTGIEFSTETAAGTLETGGIIESVTTGITPTSEEFDMIFKTMSSGATAAERLKLNGSGATVGNINLNANTLSSTNTNGNVVIAPNGAGHVQLDADTVRVGDNNANATITTNGTGDLILNTNEGSSSGSITIADGSAGDITISPDGAGSVDIKKLKIASGSTAITSILDEDDFSSDSATGLATQQSIKAYVATQVSGIAFTSGLAVTGGDASFSGGNVVLGQNGTVVFEGSTDDTNETTLTVADPQQDNTVTIPDVTGFFAMFAADPSTTTVAATPAELNIMDGGTAASSTTLVDADRLVVNDDGTMKQVALSDVKTYISSAGFSSDDPTALAIALG